MKKPTYEETLKFVEETNNHITKVQKEVLKFTNELTKQAMVHDLSKTKEPEIDKFIEYNAKLKDSAYGSEEYKENLKGLGVALDNHYQHNSHHPEHYENGIEGMNLLDIVEMLCDWKAATLRHNDGDILKSLEYNKERFGMTNQLYKILLNTIEKLDMEIK